MLGDHGAAAPSTVEGKIDSKRTNTRARAANDLGSGFITNRNGLRFMRMPPSFKDKGWTDGSDREVIIGEDRIPTFNGFYDSQ